MRTYAAERDHAAATAILRDALAHGPVPFTPHPGDWSWWTQHRDDRFPTEFLIGPHAVAEVGIGQRYIRAYGLGATQCVELGEHHVGAGPLSIGEVSVRDTARGNELRTLGFTPDPRPSPVFERTTTGGVPSASLPSGFTRRPLGGRTEGPSRAAAARRAFASTMDEAAHTARYLAFMQSPVYDRERDLVAITPDGRVAGFAMFWPDTALSLAQFEPVGVDPDFQRLGIARALIATGLELLAARGIRRARVMTNGSNAAAIACYLACGFEVVDHVAWWTRP